MFDLPAIVQDHVELSVKVSRIALRNVNYSMNDAQEKEREREAKLSVRGSVLFPTGFTLGILPGHTDIERGLISIEL